MVRVPEGIWWVPATGWVWLTTTKGAPGDWARDLSWTAIKWGGRSAVAGAVYSARSTWSRLLVPLATSTPVQIAGIIAVPRCASEDGDNRTRRSCSHVTLPQGIHIQPLHHGMGHGSLGLSCVFGQGFLPFLEGCGWFSCIQVNLSYDCLTTGTKYDGCRTPIII